MIYSNLLKLQTKVRLEQFEQLIEPEEPSQPFDEAPPKYKEVVDIVKKARAASAPGPNGVPYKVYKNCQRLTRHLWKLILESFGEEAA